MSFLRAPLMGLEWKTYYKYNMKTNERHHNIKTQGHNPTHENSEEKMSEVRFGPFLANFSWVGLALGCEVRWFHKIFIYQVS